MVFPWCYFIKNSRVKYYMVSVKSQFIYECVSRGTPILEEEIYSLHEKLNVSQTHQIWFPHHCC